MTYWVNPLPSLSKGNHVKGRSDRWRVSRAIPVVCVLIALPTASMAQTESLGEVDFAVTCKASVQDELNGAVALLHRMTYGAGRCDDARAYYQQLLDRAPHDSPRLGVSEARSYLGGITDSGSGLD